MRPPGNLTGEKVFLRKPIKRDQQEFLFLNRSSSHLHRGLVSPPKEPDEFRSFMERSRLADTALFLICQIDNGAIVGSIGLSQIFHGGFQNAYLGYFIGEKYARQGFMTEALQLALSYAFEQLKLHRLEANIQPGNTASIALVKRAGFVLEGYSERYLKICGRWRDHERWAILAETWRAHRKAKTLGG